MVIIRKNFIILIASIILFAFLFVVNRNHDKWSSFILKSIPDSVSSYSIIDGKLSFPIESGDKKEIDSLLSIILQGEKKIITRGSGVYSIPCIAMNITLNNNEIIIFDLSELQGITSYDVLLSLKGKTTTFQVVLSDSDFIFCQNRIDLIKKKYLPYK